MYFLCWIRVLLCTWWEQIASMVRDGRSTTAEVMLNVHKCPALIFNWGIWRSLSNTVGIIILLSPIVGWRSFWKGIFANRHWHVHTLNLALDWEHRKITLLRVIPTMTFIHFVTGKSSGSRGKRWRRRMDTPGPAEWGSRGRSKRMAQSERQWRSDAGL